MSDLLLRKIEPTLKAGLQSFADARALSLSDAAIMLIRRGLASDGCDDTAWEFLRRSFPARAVDPVPFSRVPASREPPFDDAD